MFVNETVNKEMKNKTIKHSKCVTYRKRALSDVSPATSIPPLVEGHLRCFLRVTVSKVLWTIIKPPPVTLIRLRWWGESSNGTLFKPKDGHTEQKSVKSTARFPVRCGPKQLTSYLTDMGSLVLDVLTKVDHLPIARAQIPGIARLSLSHSINGYFTLVSPSSDKLGELQVTLALEPLTEGYESSSSLPTTDLSLDAQTPAGTAEQKNWPAPHTTLDHDQVQKAVKEAQASCSGHIPRGKDFLYFQETIPSSSTRIQDGAFAQNPADLLSVLLERGNKLRNAMVMSALKSDVESKAPAKNDPHSLSRDTTDAFPCKPPSGQFLENILHSELQHPAQHLKESSQVVINMEDKAVDLLFGRMNGSMVPFWDGEGSLPDSLSDDNSVHMDSELNDPQYDHSLLENLFYKAPLSEKCLEEEYQRKGSGAKQMDKSPVRRTRPNSDVQHLEAEDGFSGLTLDRIDLLGDIRFAKVKSTSFHSSPLVVTFQHQNVFPVRFSPSSMKQWMQINLTFKVYSRNTLQKKPTLIGSALFPMSSILLSESLGISAALPVQGTSGSPDEQKLGPLKVSLELAADKNDFSSKKQPQKLQQLPPRGLSSSQTQEQDQQEITCFRDPSPDIHSILVPPARSLSPHVRFQSSPQQQEVEEPGVLLHLLLMVPDGKDFNCAPMQPNVFLSCKLLGSEEPARSTVSWAQRHPTFSFTQVAPVALTSRLLERMKNNMMVIEVWLRANSSDHDKLLGLVKLPLHQFYMSHRDPKISELLLQSNYPVVGVDSYMPVVDVFSGSTRGNLRVCLALGLSHQIRALQQVSPGDELSQVTSVSRPDKVTVDVLQEHVFLIRVDRVKGLTPLQSTVWGEADCYIQYSFPAQDECREDIDAHVVESDVELKSYRSETTLCVPDPVFGHSETHVLLSPPDVPVQRILLNSLARQGLRSGGGVQFEVWCRYYYPNVRDQLVARGLLPMSKLCAMVTLQKQGQIEAQQFSLPLIPRTDRPDDTQHQSPGLLEVTIQYKSRPMRSLGMKSGVVPSRSVTLVLEVHRAAGLQAAARVLAHKDSSLQFYSEVGLNSFITMQLSFLPDGELRSTRVAARSFCPEFEHHAEFCCNLLVQRDSGERVSLAELLQEALAIFTIYNRDTRKMIDVRLKDTLIGTVKIKLVDLIQKRSGGLEISISFSHHADRERVISSARALGWDLNLGSEDEDNSEDEDASEESSKSLTLSLSMPRAWLPIHCLLLPGHDDLQRSTYCYYRYKLYEQPTVCSELKHPVPSETEGDEGLASVAFQSSRSMSLRRTRALRWYLREEKLEVQLWVSFGKEKRVRPHDTDRLLGSAFLDLSALAGRLKQHQTVSGVYPLFKRSAVNLSGAALRIHITASTISAPHQSQAIEELLSSGEENTDECLSTTAPSPSKQPNNQSDDRTEETPSILPITEDTFIANISVDRAMHLSLKGCPLAERSGGLPTCCVSYTTADATDTVTTELVKDSDCPVWDHQQECRLSKKLLLDPQQSLVFKVWHKGEIERVIGFVSVDLSPLLSGFQSVCGWYNITDFNGQCQGQLKVSVSPLKAVQDLRGQRQTVQETLAPDSSAFFNTLPFCYQTTATYSNFPCHISRFSEQRIRTPPEQFERLLSERSSVADRHDEHVDNIRIFHQSLHETEKASHTSLTGDSHPSSSVLFSALRKNLSELDDIQRYFSRKLSTPTFPKLSKLRESSGHEEHQDPEPDTTELLLKSSQLVGEVNDIIKGLSAHPSEEVPTTEKSTIPSPDAVEELSPSRVDQLISPESESCEIGADFNKHSGIMMGDGDNALPYEARVSPVLPEDEKLHHSSSDPSSDEENIEDEDFEETLIQPRTLNEVTSVTDRTSPWTSLLSDPDMASLESLEDHIHEGVIQTQERLGNLCKHLEVTPPSLMTESRGVDSDSDSSGQSENHQESFRQEASSSTDHHKGQVLLDDLDKDDVLSSIIEEDSDSRNSGVEEVDERPNLTCFAESGSVSDEAKDEETTKISESVEIPNFFLSAQRLEASMRVLRMAPVFPSTVTDLETVNALNSYRRIPRSRPSIPPSQRSEETKRIAKIFASKFAEEP
ncbi:hypothetical protein DNTS_010822 [Danionella cerebrum]|uniref:C2 domain-containing protein n=1 Tax=Danionella cerebrum TaxID=2873325 RepID=A0A553QHL0_9TELE|nr:hypothetical protein DNTS_010822 [Danionella translucida]